jgi:shikimate kinase
MEGNIYLTGFSGTGKTNTGKRVAELMGWEFFEMDERIEQLEKKKIPDIFATQGEGHFRHVESRVLSEASKSGNRVVSTGGGVPTVEKNRRLMAKHGMVIRLSASPETIHARLNGSYGQRGRALRPLLGGEAPVERIEQLLREREQHYATADVTIDTEGLSHEQVAQLVIDAWEKIAPSKGFTNV